ncbi:hypothetical protein [Streptococcus pneumoniae]|nr:hypothetical protein [Streptococcus pneumoniae]
MDRTDEVSNHTHGKATTAQNTVFNADRTDEVSNHTYGNVR